jgi:hypothetical protein
MRTVVSEVNGTSIVAIFLAVVDVFVWKVVLSLLAAGVTYRYDSQASGQVQ